MFTTTETIWITVGLSLMAVGAAGMAYAARLAVREWWG
jgi:hypothetical protein